MAQSEYEYHPLQKLPGRYRPTILVRPGDEHIEESFIAPDEHTQIRGQALAILQTVGRDTKFRNWNATVAPAGREDWTTQLMTPDSWNRLAWSTLQIAYSLSKDSLRLRREEVTSNQPGYRIDNFELELDGLLARETDVSIQANKSAGDISFDLHRPVAAATLNDWQTYMQEKVADDMLPTSELGGFGGLGRIRSWFRSLDTR